MSRSKAFGAYRSNKQDSGFMVTHAPLNARRVTPMKSKTLRRTHNPEAQFDIPNGSYTSIARPRCLCRSSLVQSQLDCTISYYIILYRVVTLYHYTMLYYAILYYIMSCQVLPCCTVLSCIVLCYNIVHYMMLSCIILGGSRDLVSRAISKITTVIISYNPN